MSLNAKLKLKSNPFRMTPAVSPKEIIWAGFPDVKEKFEKRIERSIRISNSTLILNWGEYGSGKTHAARYFSKKSVLKSIADKHALTPPFSSVIVLPKGKDPVYDMFTALIDRINIQRMRELFQDVYPQIEKAIKNFTDNIYIQNIIKAFFTDADEILLKKFFYGNLSATELKELNRYGILRALSTDSDYTKLLSSLFTCLTFEKKIFSSIIIWIDEFEDIAILNNVNIDKANNFIRELLDNTPNNLLVFLNLTQSALVDIEDLGQYLSEAVRSRIKDRIDFELPDEEQILKYLMDLLNNPLYREGKSDDQLFPFTQETIDVLFRDLKGSASIRRYNEAFSLLIELADLEDHVPIDKAFYEGNKKEIIGWKE